MLQEKARSYTRTSDVFVGIFCREDTLTVMLCDISPCIASVFIAVSARVSDGDTVCVLLCFLISSPGSHPAYFER